MDGAPGRLLLRPDVSGLVGVFFGRPWSRGGAVGSGLVLGVPARSSVASTAVEPRTSGIRRRVLLGRTGIEVSDISFGSFSIESDERLVHHVLDRGITHFDTAET